MYHMKYDPTISWRTPVKARQKSIYFAYTTTLIILLAHVGTKAQSPSIEASDPKLLAFIQIRSLDRYGASQGFHCVALDFGGIVKSRTLMPMHLQIAIIDCPFVSNTQNSG